MTNVNGNWKKRKPIQRNLSLKKIPGQGVKTHDVMKGISFKDKAYKWGASTRAGAQKVYGKIGRSYKKYGKPTETLFRKTGAGVLGVGKSALKRGALGFPGLAATGLYYAGKHIGTKAGAKKFKYPGHREFDKRGRKFF